MSYTTPPRGSGKHWRDERATDPRGQPVFREPHPSDTQMDPPMQAGPGPDGRRRRIIIEREEGPTPTARYQDLIVPRVFVEPDERMDALRRSSLRLGRWRDAAIITIVLYLLGSWTMPPLWHLLGG